MDPRAPYFSLRARLKHFRPFSGDTWEAACAVAPAGAFGRLMKAIWLPPHGDGRQVYLKIMSESHSISAGESITTRDMFLQEADVHLKARLVEQLWPLRSNVVGIPSAQAIGLRHLSFAYCVGIDDEMVPSHFLIAMEPLEGGTLWDRLQLKPPRSPHDKKNVPVYVSKPLPPLDALLFATDLMAAVAALNALGYSHSDLK
jgi:serine/threonine protein kinase